VSFRFAPSPTRLLNVADGRTALLNWLAARSHAGAFILRLDDTNAEQATPEFAGAISEDLDWMGLDWDRTVRQSDRLDDYADAIARLREGGHVYPCYETPQELAAQRAVQRAAGQPPLYDRAGLALSDAQRSALESEGRAPYWRLRLRDTAFDWQDVVHGPIHVAPGTMSDPVIVRADRRPLALLASVVDDIEFGVHQIVRGEDYLSRTSAEIQLFEAIGARPPAYAHHSRLAVPAGSAPDALTLRRLREAGVEPMALNSYLAKVCSSDPVKIRQNLKELRRDFDLGKLGRATATYEAAAVETLGRKFVHGMPFEVAAPRLAALGLDDAGKAFWEAIRSAIDALPEALAWWHIVYEPVEPVIEEPGLAAAAADLLPDGGWSRGTWLEWTVRVANATGRSRRDLYRPLRLALTGRGNGPEMQDLLPLIGPDRAAARLRGHTA
jgi:glutamyl-tRNA synthetase